MTRTERGAGTLLVLGAMQLALLLSAALVLLGGYAVAAHHARAAADLSALSGAQARVEGRDACTAARRIAERQGTRLIRCATAGDAIDFVVTVNVAAPIGLSHRRLPRQVTATAHAGSVEASGGRPRQ